ncbi:MAG: response regulator transcription factor [Cyanobacteria bacterium]|nr:response regulator transcription factor [Cyanobacteriota bacterium]
MFKILVIEDDKILSALVKQYLLLQKYEVDIALDGEEGLELLSNNDYAAAIIDWELPGLIGPSVCKSFRSRGGQTPIILLTKKSKVSEKVSGFDSGADDYLCKPFEMPELYARLQALLRRPPAIKERLITIENLVIDCDRRTAMVAGQALDLTRKEFVVLELLASNPDRLFTPDSIMNKVWSFDKDITVWAVRSTISRIRTKITAVDQRCASLIKNIYGQGYKLASSSDES